MGSKFVLGAKATLAFAVLSMLMTAPAVAQSASDKLVAARAAAQADHNARSAELFQEAIAADPSLRDVVLIELADQLTYANHSPEAVPLYRELLAHKALSTDERQHAMKGLALALAWSGQHDAAIIVYDNILAEDPGSVSALIGRGRVLTWQRRYPVAQRDLNQALSADPRSAEARRALADAQSLAGHHREALATLEPLAGMNDFETLKLIGRTQLWAGRYAQAKASLDRALTARKGDKDTEALLRQAEIADRPQTEISFRVTSQSDDTDIRQLVASQTFGVSDDVTLRLEYDDSVFLMSDGLSVRVNQPGAFGRLRISDVTELSAGGGLTIENGPAETHQFFSYNARLTLTPSDRLRFDFGAERSTPDNIRSILLDIRMNNYAASIDVGSDAAWKLALRGIYATYSDGNRRSWEQLEIRRRVAWQPNVFLGARYTHFEFERQVNSGYFNPNRLDAAEALAQVWGRAGPVYYDVRGTVGCEDAQPGGSRLVYSAQGQFTWVMTERLQLELFVNSFSSRASAPGGFSRTTLGVAARTRW